MQATSTNGSATSALEMLDSVRAVVARLEAELKKEREVNAQLRADRSEYHKIICDLLKNDLLDPKDWDDFDPKDYTLTIDDMLKVLD